MQNFNTKIMIFEWFSFIFICSLAKKMLIDNHTILMTPINLFEELLL